MAATQYTATQAQPRTAVAVFWEDFRSATAKPSARLLRWLRILDSAYRCGFVEAAADATQELRFGGASEDWTKHEAAWLGYFHAALMVEGAYPGTKPEDCKEVMQRWRETFIAPLL